MAGSSTARRRDIGQVVAELAPPAPPCFEARDIWLRYLTSAADMQRLSTRTAASGPIALGADGALDYARLNPGFSFCTDCALTANERRILAERNRCDPSWWRNRVQQPQDQHQAAPQPRRVIPIAVG